MNKTELITKLAKKTGLTQAKAAEAVDAIFNATRPHRDRTGRRPQGHAAGFGGFFRPQALGSVGPQPGHGATIQDPLSSVPGFQGREDPQGKGSQVGLRFPA